MLKKISTITIATALLVSATPTFAAEKTSATRTSKNTKTHHSYKKTNSEAAPLDPSPAPAPLPVAPTQPSAPNIISTSIPWGTTIFDGYGSVTWNSALQQLNMAPQAATQPSETHASLVVSSQTLKQPFQLSYTMKTIQQLRTGSTPNPWETGWILFGYKPDGKFKYIVLKPQGYGVEMGESLLNNAQDFLYTSTFNQDIFPVNDTYNVVLNVKNNVVTMTVNGKQYVSYAMSGNDQLTADGQYGFYTEDANVQVSNIVAQQL